MRHLVFAAMMAVSVAHAADVQVKSAWARATVPSQKVTGAFMELKSARGATLVGARSPVAGSVEVHEMKMDGDTMRMREIPSLELPAGKVVKLAPGGYHVMMFDLKRQLKAGERIPVALEVERGGKRERVDVAVEVRGVE